MKKIITIKEATLSLITAGLIALAGCESIELTPIQQTEITPSTQTETYIPEEYQEGYVEDPIIEEPVKPEPIYSDWYQSEWTTEVYNESDTCRLVETKQVSEPTWSAWSEWSTEPGQPQASDTVQVRTKEEVGFVCGYVEVTVFDDNGYIIPDEYHIAWDYIHDPVTHERTRALQTYYSYRTKLRDNSYEMRLYEFRDLLNYDEIEAYEIAKSEQDAKKLLLSND